MESEERVEPDERVEPEERVENVAPVAASATLVSHAMVPAATASVGRLMVRFIPIPGSSVRRGVYRKAILVTDSGRTFRMRRLEELS